MKDQVRLIDLKNIENKISNELEKPSYRDCLIVTVNSHVFSKNKSLN